MKYYILPLTLFIALASCAISPEAVQETNLPTEGLGASSDMVLEEALTRFPEPNADTKHGISYSTNVNAKYTSLTNTYVDHYIVDGIQLSYVHMRNTLGMDGRTETIYDNSVDYAYLTSQTMTELSEPVYPIDSNIAVEIPAGFKLYKLTYVRYEHWTPEKSWYGNSDMINVDTYRLIKIGTDSIEYIYVNFNPVRNAYVLHSPRENGEFDVYTAAMK